MTAGDFCFLLCCVHNVGSGIGGPAGLGATVWHRSLALNSGLGLQAPSLCRVTSLGPPYVYMHTHTCIQGCDGTILFHACPLRNPSQPWDCRPGLRMGPGILPWPLLLGACGWQWPASLASDAPSFRMRSDRAPQPLGLFQPAWAELNMPVVFSDPLRQIALIPWGSCLLALPLCIAFQPQPGDLSFGGCGPQWSRLAWVLC